MTAPSVYISSRSVTDRQKMSFTVGNFSKVKVTDKNTCFHASQVWVACMRKFLRRRALPLAKVCLQRLIVIRGYTDQNRMWVWRRAMRPMLPNEAHYFLGVDRDTTRGRVVDILAEKVVGRLILTGATHALKVVIVVEDRLET